MVYGPANPPCRATLVGNKIIVLGGQGKLLWALKEVRPKPAALDVSKIPLQSGSTVQATRRVCAELALLLASCHQTGVLQPVTAFLGLVAFDLLTCCLARVPESVSLPT